MHPSSAVKGIGACALLGIAWLGVLPLRACPIPVFRDALERWPADAYEVVVFHEGPLAPEAAEAAERLKDATGGAAVNIEVRLEDLAREPRDPGLEALWAAQGAARLPWMVVRYPPAARIDAGAPSIPARQRTRGVPSLPGIAMASIRPARPAKSPCALPAPHGRPRTDDRRDPVPLPGELRAPDLGGRARVVGRGTDMGLALHGPGAMGWPRASHRPRRSRQKRPHAGSAALPRS